MADYRQIHVLIWDDDWFCQLSSAEKVVFIWLFSNRNASVSGIYQFSMFICGRETGLSQKIVTKALNKLIEDGKIVVENDWVWVKNLRKYNYNKSQNTDRRIQIDLEQLPDGELKNRYLEYHKGIDSPYQAPTKSVQEHRTKNIKNIEQLKEVEEGKFENNYSATTAPLDNFNNTGRTPYIRIFSAVTGMVGIPGNKPEAFAALDTLMDVHKSEEKVIEFLKPYWEAWRNLKTENGKPYSKTNLVWLTEKAIAEEIPRKNGKGKHTIYDNPPQPSAEEIQKALKGE
jgi:hypothetical protein